MSRPSWMGMCLFVALTAASGAGRTVAQDAAPPRVDNSGDPLPPGALTRLGSLRWRHPEAVTLVAFLPDGKSVLTGAEDRILRLWDRATGKELCRFNMPRPKAVAKQQPVRISASPGSSGLLAALSSDGKILAGADTGVLELWDVATGKKLHQFKAPPQRITTIRFSPDGKLLALRDGTDTIHLISTETGETVNQFKSNGKNQPRTFVVGGRATTDLGNVAFAPDGKCLASLESAILDQVTRPFIRIHDIANGNVTCRIDLPAPPTTLAYAPNGKLLAVALAGEILLFDPHSGLEIRKWKIPVSVTTALVFTPNSQTLVGRSMDETVFAWEVGTGKELQVFSAVPLDRVNVPRLANGGDSQNLAIAPDGKTVATGWRNSVRMWEVGSGQEQPLASGHRAPVQNVGVSADGTRAFSRGSDRLIRTWDLASGRELSQFVEPMGTSALTYAPDGATLAFIGRDGLRLFDAATGKPRTQPAAKERGGPFGNAAVYSRDGKIVALVTANAILLHDAVTLKLLQQIVIPQPGATEGVMVVVRSTGSTDTTGLSVAFSPDGKTLIGRFPANPLPMVIRINGAAASAATVIRLWDIATGKELRKFTLPNQLGGGSMTLSPDGRVLACENADGTVSLWELSSGKERARLGKVEVAEAPKDVNSVFAAVLVAPNAMPPRTVASTVVFSPDGRLIACKGPAGSVRVWDVDAGTELAHFTGHDGPVRTLVFTPDSRRLVTGSADTTLLVWDVAGLSRPAAAPSGALSVQDQGELWDTLLGDDAGTAVAAIRRLAAHPQEAVPLLRDKVKRAVPVEPKKLDELIARLDSDDFEERNDATQALARLGELAIPKLHEVVNGQPTLEARRRVEALLLRLTTGALSPEQVRLVRAIEVLERAATPDARQTLRVLASGAAGALVTREAQAAFARLR